jgi:hypothetical protein
MDKQIVYNAVKCLECNETIVSHHRHDYKTCGCLNEAMVDGGTAYLRYGAKNMRNIELITVYADEDYQLVRNYATRGSRGVDGKQPLKWIPLCDMDDDHLEACLDYGGADWHMNLIRKEIAYRKLKEHQKKIIIELMNMDSYEPKGCACYGSNAMHECNCK